MYLREFISLSKDALNTNNSTEAELLVCYVLKFQKREDLLFNSDRMITKEELAACNDLIRRRNKGEPISQIIGYKEFWDSIFVVNNKVLTPRSDSEVIIEMVIKYFQKRDQESLKILDLGTGSGCLIVTLLKIYSKAFGVGVDISDDALKVATQNAKALQVDNRLELLKSNWFGAIKPGTKFDIIVCNPPYITKEELYGCVSHDVRDYEPEIALTDGADGLSCYKALAPYLMHYLFERGIAFFELGQGQADSVSKIFRDMSYRVLEIMPDLAGIKRVIAISGSQDC